MSVGDKIKELRMLSGMSQEELGRRIGVQRAAINKYEKGTVTNIPLNAIERIASVFDVSPTYIVGWSEDGCNPLAAEVKVIHGMQKFFGKDSVELVETYLSLSNVGKRKLLQYADDMSKIYPIE